jgi:hypothetical protein
MNRRNLTISTKTLVILFAIIGSVNILVSAATLSPVFSIASTSPAQDPFLRTSTAQDISIILKGIQEFLSPSGYEQAREDPSYVINIPFSELGYSSF